MTRGRRAVLIAGLTLATISATFVAPTPATAATDSGTKSLGGPGSQSIESIAAVDGGFVAVGNEVIGGDAAAVVWHGSLNGHTWKRAARPAVPIPTGDPLETTMAAVASSDSIVVAVGQAEDNPAVHPPGGYPTAPVFWHATGDGAFVLGASDTAAEAAQVPANWDFGQFRPTSVASGDGRFVAGGSVIPPSGNPACSHPLTWLSTDDGSSWRVAAVPFPPGGAGSVEAVTYDASSGFVAVGATYDDECGGQSTAALWGSSDGTSWRQYSLPAGSDALGVAASDDLVVVMGVGTKVRRGGCDAVFWTSADLDSWTTTDDSIRERAVGAVALADGSFVAFGSQCTKDGSLFPLAYRMKPGGDWKPLQFDQPKEGSVLAAASKGRSGGIL